ncbi:MAG: hypothetical protein FWD31_02400, partial [Planctomycetaceae bacterium]|nr:hypothetical protein [Planctomycetaceae bacterium]
MFKLHDKTRRLLTLSIFLLLGPALLIVVLTGAYSRHSVRTVNGWEALFSHAMGKRVEIESVSFPAPGMVRFSQMRIFAPNANEVLLHIPQWDLIECFGEMPQHIDPALWTRSDGQAASPSQKTVSHTGFYEPDFPRTRYKRGLFASIGFACSGLFGKQASYRICEIPEISFHHTALPHAKDVLLEIMAKLPDVQANDGQSHTGVNPIALFVSEIRINLRAEQTDANATSKTDCILVRNACFELRPTAKQTTFLATFHPADQSFGAQPFQLVVSRERGGTAPTQVRFSSGDHEVPAQMLTGFDPFFNSFGSQSRFRGTVVAESGANKRQKQPRTFELTDAVFYNVALESLLSKSLTFRLDGVADKVTLDSVKFSNESNDSNAMRLEFAQGTIINARGIASWPGLRRLVQGTNLRLSPHEADPPDTDVTFRDGTFAFLMDRQGIRLGFGPKLDDQSQQYPLMAIDNHCVVLWPKTQHIIRY